MEKRKVFGRIDTQVTPSSSATTPTSRSIYSVNASSGGAGGGPSSRARVTPITSHGGVNTATSATPKATPTSGVAGANASGGRPAIRSAASGLPSSSTSSSLRNVAAAAAAGAGAIRAKVAGYDGSTTASRDRDRDRVLADSPSTAATPPPAAYRSSPLTSSSRAATAIVAHIDDRPPPKSVSTRSFDRKVRAASTEPLDSPTAHLGNGNGPQSSTRPTSPARRVRAFPSTVSSSSIADRPPSSQGSHATRSTKVSGADPLKYSVTSRPANASLQTLLPSPSLSKLSSSSSEAPAVSAARPKTGPHVPSAATTIFGRGAIYSGSPPASPHSVYTSVSGRPASPVRRPGSPLRVQASPSRSSSALPASVSTSSTAQPPTLHSPRRPGLLASTSSSTLTPTSASRTACQRVLPPEASTSAVADDPPSAYAKRPSTSSQSSSSASTSVSLSPEIFSDSARSVSVRTKAKSSNFHRGRRRTLSFDSSFSSVSDSGEDCDRVESALSAKWPPEMVDTPRQKRPQIFSLFSHGRGGEGSHASPERANDKAQQDAKIQRKIADLEITNTSLMAINANLEKTKIKQAQEIRELRRRMQAPLPSSTSSGGLLLSPRTDDFPWLNSAEVGSSPLLGASKEDYDENYDWDEILRRDVHFAEVVRAVEELHRTARDALQRSTESEAAKVGGRVLNPFESRAKERQESDAGKTCTGRSPTRQASSNPDEEAESEADVDSVTASLADLSLATTGTGVSGTSDVSNGSITSSSSSTIDDGDEDGSTSFEASMLSIHHPGSLSAID